VTLAMLMGVFCPASAQQVGRAGKASLPQAPLAQMQLAQAAIPGLPAQPGSASLTWEQVKAKFEAANPVLKSDQSNVDEMKAEEITAYLRPNPQFTMTADGLQIAPNGGQWHPVYGEFAVPNFSYLHEREHKRELRLESAQQGTRIATSEHQNLDRTMLFGLRSAFVGTLEAKAVWIWRRPIWSTTTRSSTSARRGMPTATCRISTWTGSSCCGCSTSRRSRRRS
jgi:cobalt-zinc-cadmium efflux system outer membrane protein